ncbi:MAG: FAD-dependent monooxygenase [Pseudomonadota bacterium]
MSAPSRLKILVAGAGIAGLSAAAALGRAGHAVTVVERAEALREVGAGLQLSPNAMKAVDFLGAGAPVRAAGFAPEAVELRLHASGRLVWRNPLTDAEARFGAPYLQVHRADLLRALAEAATAAGAELAFGETAESASPEGVLTTDLGERRADLILAADGVRSALRKDVAGASAPRFSGHVAFRGLVETSRLPRDLIRPAANVWMGPRAHFVSYFLRGGALVNFVAVVERAAWTSEGWSAPGDLRALRDAFAPWHLAVRKLLENCEETWEWGLFDHAPLPRWSSGRVALIGDAAHPTTPFMAQGAAMALEDAVTLARALDRDAPGPALAAWEASRKPRCTRLQAAARRNGGRFHSRSLPERWVKAGALAAFGALLPSRARALTDWVYRYDPTCD